MNQRRFISLFAVSLLVVYVGQSAQADVVTRKLRAGEIPNDCPAGIKTIIAKVKSIEGVESEGFNWISSTLYCRGTHDEIQSLLDALLDSESIVLTVKIDSTGKPGIIKPQKNAANPRSRWYVYRLSFGRQLSRHALKPEPSSVHLTIFSVGGVRPNDLRFPRKTKPISHFEAD